MHGKHCMRYKYKSKDLTCRFNFPQPLGQRSSIDNSDGYLRYHPKRNDPYCKDTYYEKFYFFNT